MKSYLKLFILPAIFITAAFTAKAVSMGEVIGQVLEKETNKPVAFAEVIFENNMDKIVVRANEYGYYYGGHIPTGRYQMRVVFNNRTFVINKVRVYDSYSSEVNFIVSANENLPSTVEVIKTESLVSAIQSTDIRVVNNSSSCQATQNLAEVLLSQPGVDMRNGKLYIKGSDQVRYFIDGTPVMAPPALDRIW